MQAAETIRGGMLTVAEVAARLRIGRSSAYALCQEPEFPALRILGQIRVPADAFEAWLRDRPTVAGSDV